MAGSKSAEVHGQRCRGLDRDPVDVVIAYHQRTKQIDIDGDGVVDNDDAILISDIIEVFHWDCDGNGVQDTCQILAGDIPDLNANGVPDQCECLTDINADGTTNVLDLIDLLLCFGQPAVPGCETEDVNLDGTVNVLDLIDLLLAFGTACP